MLLFIPRRSRGEKQNNSGVAPNSSVATNCLAVMIRALQFEKD
jgi:hypothetical protein